jgi:hypothetical protein
MTKLIALALFLCSLNALAFPGSANIGAVATNPSNGTVLATSGSLSSGCASGTGIYKVKVFASSSAAATFDLQSIFSGSPVSHIYLMTPAQGSVNLEPEISFAVPDAITLSVVNVGSITGTVQVNLFWALEKCQ